jgi:signal transduction histidine kinase
VDEHAGQTLAGEQFEQLARLVGQAPVGLALIDAGLRFQFINQTLAAINGIPVAAHIGRTVREVVPDLADDAEPLLRGVLERGEPLLGVELVGETLAAPGVRRVWREDFFPLRDEAGCAVAVGVVCVEITAQRQAEAELRESEARYRAELEALLARERSAREAAQHAIQERETFIAVASHDLRAPLTVLAGQAQLLERRGAQDGLSERGLRSVQTIGQQAARLNRMINNLLDLSRIQAGRLEIDRELIDLAALVRRIVAEVQPTLTAHALTLAGDDQPLVVLGDELRLEQVFNNLIANAVKYSPSGGTVLLLLERRAAGAFATVADQGIGIPAAALPHLFDQGYRVPAAAARGIGGMGIGLFVVKQIVTLHGGTVEVASEEGRGSRFTICLPLAEGGAAIPEEHAPTHTRAGAIQSPP